MKVSKIGLITRKLESLDTQFPVQDMLIQTGQIIQYSSGIYGYGHIPFLVEQKINEIISQVLTKYGCAEVSLPLLQPESLWLESGRLDKYVASDVMFQSLTSKGNYCLAPTAEEAIVSYAKPILTSYKQLPVTYFQIGPKFRNEIRTRGYLLRGKVFNMMDAYSFGKNQADLNFEYDKMKEAYLEIFKILGLDTQAVLADNGDMGGKRSEEFMCLSPIGEDKILVDEKTNKAFNSELLDKPDYIEYIKECYGIEDINALVTKKAVELGHIFQLDDFYGKVMNATYIDEKDKEQPYVMGCYGIGISRTLALLYENNIKKSQDNKFEGVVLPINISPYLVYIIPKLDQKEKVDKALEVYNELIANGVKVLYDDREDITIGAKLKDSKIVGTPYVAVFGNTLDQGFVEVENNLTNEKIKIFIEEFSQVFKVLEQTKNSNNTIENIIKNDI